MLNKIMLPQKAIFQENKTTNIWKINIKIQMNFFFMHRSIQKPIWLIIFFKAINIRRKLTLFLK